MTRRRDCAILRIVKEGSPLKTICKVFAVLAVLTGILTLVAAAFAQEQKPEYIRIYGEPAEENE